MNSADNNKALSPTANPNVVVIGGGPAGLMAAETLLAGGASVDLYDAMPSVGRKFLLAGKGGLNLTHSEDLAAFIERYGPRSQAVSQWLDAFGPQALRDWAQELGISTFVGSSGRVFPKEMKAAPLLRAWLHRLRGQGLRLHMRQRWLGWDDAGSSADAAGQREPRAVLQPEPQPQLGLQPLHEPQREPQLEPQPQQRFPAQAHRLRFEGPAGTHGLQADALVLALGGASWPRLGSDGAWAPWLQQRGVALAPLRPANCGFDVGWSAYFAERFAGAPLKSVRLKFEGADGRIFDRQGEFVITAGGIEGSLVYAASAPIRDAIEAQGQATVLLDLVPGRSAERLAQGLAHGRGTRSLPNHLREHAGLDGAKAALLRERYSAPELSRLLAEQPAELARLLKAWPLTLTACRPVAEAISTAGGVQLEALDNRLMLRALPGVFCAGEMLDWEAPTGGYLLSASFASGRVAGQGLLDWWRTGAAAERRIPG